MMLDCAPKLTRQKALPPQGLKLRRISFRVRGKYSIFKRECQTGGGFLMLSRLEMIVYIFDFRFAYADKK